MTIGSKIFLTVRTMDILVHGTKGGLNIFTPTKLSGLLDVTADGAKASAIGEQAYAFRFMEANTIFSKYKIIRDVRGEKRTGFVAFSLFLPNNKKLLGAEIIAFLDRVSDEYCQEYIIDNNLNNVKENWDFLDNISSEYETKVRTVSSDSANTLQSGSKDDAFVYFKEMDELRRNFDAPFQEEYTPYRQILFISKDLESKPENPLNALRNSGVELTNIDLENKPYYLNNYDRNKGVSISANGKLLSERKNNNCIRAKWHVEIKYSKDEKCFDPIEAEGTLSNPESEIYKYLEIKDENVIVKYDAFKNPTPKAKTISFEIKDHKGNPINDAEIQIGTQQWERVNGDQHLYTFKGEELKVKWTINVRKESVNLFLENFPVFPEQQSVIKLILHKKLVIKIFAVDNEGGNNFPNFRFWADDNKGFRDNITELIYTDDEIEKTYNIEISTKEGPVNYSGRIGYCPATGKNPIYVKLHRTTEQSQVHKTYKIDAGKHGKKSTNCQGYSLSNIGNDLRENCIEPDKGYSFKEWKLNEEKDTLIAQYHKKKPIFRNSTVLLSFVVFIILIISSWFLISIIKTDSVQRPITSLEIKNYVEGDSLLIKKLNSYKVNWEKQKPQKSKKTTERNDLNKVLQNIDKAIQKRKLIDNANFEDLVKYEYYPQQGKFINTARKIKSDNYVAIKKQLGDVSALTLNQIADSINAILTLEEKQKESNERQITEDEKNPGEINPEQQQQQQQQPAKNQTEKVARQTVRAPKVPTEKITEITNYINGNELDKEVLSNYKTIKGIPTALEKSIQLCLNIWEFDGKGKNTYYSLYEDVKKDNNFTNNNFKNILNEICEIHNPKYFKELPDQDKKKIKTIEDLKLKIKEMK